MTRSDWIVALLLALISALLVAGFKAAMHTRNTASCAAGAACGETFP